MRGSSSGRLPLLLGLLLLSACSSVPYRIEWGWKRAHGSGDSTTSDSSSTKKPALSSTWLAWKAFHGDLVRAVERRSTNEPAPHAIFADCKRALQRASARYTGDEKKTLDEAVQRYEDLEKEVERSTPNWSLRELDHIRDLVESVPPVPSTPVAQPPPSGQ